MGASPELFAFDYWGIKWFIPALFFEILGGQYLDTAQDKRGRMAVKHNFRVKSPPFSKIPDDSQGIIVKL